jgi:hypothetical protein
VGITTFIEGLRGQRFGSGLQIAPMDAWRMVGRGAGQLVTLIFGPRVFRAGRGFGLRVLGRSPVVVELVMTRQKVPLENVRGLGFMQKFGHLVIRVIEAARDKTQAIERTGPRLEHIRRFERYGSEGDVVTDLEYPPEDLLAGARVRYEVTEADLVQAEARLGQQTQWGRYIATDTALRGFGPTKNCSTLPGELGLGLRLPFMPPLAVIAAHGMVYGGYAAIGVGWATAGVLLDS